MKGVSVTALKLSRQFYLVYPQIGQTLTDQFEIPLRKTISDASIKMISPIGQTLSDQLVISQKQLEKHNQRLAATLSFSHFVELIQINDPLKRIFYEIECINGTWTIRELKRQIGSLLYERTGLSSEKGLMIKIVNEQASQLTPRHIIRDPYIFEFLGISQHDILLENDLENALLEHLQHFLLELGKGFCFEARQRRITVDNEHFLLIWFFIIAC